MQLPDVNVLIYAHREDAPEHERYAAWLRALTESDEPFAVYENAERRDEPDWPRDQPADSAIIETASPPILRSRRRRHQMGCAVQARQR
jgi:hypothetical protein